MGLCLHSPVRLHGAVPYLFKRPSIFESAQLYLISYSTEGTKLTKYWADGCTGKCFILRTMRRSLVFNPLNVELNPICHLLALLGAHHILHVSRIRVKRRIISHLPFSGIIRSSPYSARWQDKS